MIKIMMIMMMNDKDSDDEDYDGDDDDDDDNNSDDIDDDGDWEVVRNTDCASVGVQIATRPIVRYTRCRLGIHNLSDNNDDDNDDEVHDENDDGQLQLSRFTTVILYPRWWAKMCVKPAETFYGDGQYDPFPAG